VSKSVSSLSLEEKDKKESESISKKKKAAKGEDDGDDDEDDNEEDEPKEKKKEAPKKAVSSAPTSVLISKSSRNRKKFITSVKGLEAFGLNLKVVAKQLSKKFACSASVVKTTTGEEINLQGDVDRDVADYIQQEFKEVDAKLITLVDSKTGKKIKLFS